MTDKSNTQAANHLSAEAANALLKRVAALREPFETWATGQGYTLAFEDRGYMQTYRFTETEHAWRGYCHAALAAQPTPEPTFTGIAARKLDGLKGRGYVVDGYSIQHAETKQRGFITAGGFVGWWINMDHVQPTPEPVAQAEEIERLRKALVYVAFALHATPQHQLATGISLIDADTVQVRLDGWMIEASTNPARQPAAPSPVALQGRDEVKAIMEEIAEYGRVSDACGRSRGPNNYAMNESAVARFVDLQEEIHRDLIALAARASLPAGGVVEPGMLTQHHRDSAELRRLCQTRDDARRERDAARAEIAGLNASVGHLSAMVDGQTRLVQKAVGIMKALHESATPIDGPDMDAQIPGHAFHVFVDGHAELMHALATGPQITTPQPSETQGRRQMTEDSARLDAMQRHRIALIPEFEGPWDAHLYGDDGEPESSASGDTPRSALDALLAHHGIPASHQDGGGQA